jgi:hypothetical protein
MPETVDLKRVWLAKFSQCLDDSVETEIHEQVMAGNDGLTADSGRDEVFARTKGAMGRLGVLVEGETGKQVIRLLPNKPAIHPL